MWMMVLSPFGFHISGWYSTMSYPTQITTSACAKANQGKSRARNPIVPSDKSFEKGMTPFAMNVLATGMRSTCAKLISESVAPCRMTPLPASTTGHFALEMMRAASSILNSGGAEVYGICTLIGALSTALSAMFSGKSMNAAPGFSVCATLNALRTISGTISGSRICAAYLVIGWNRLIRSRI